MKNCSSCKQIKAFNLFYRCKSKKDGFSNECKACNKIRKLIQSKSPKAKETRQKWLSKNKTRMVEYHKEYSKNYYKAHSKKYKERNDKWRYENPERIKQLNRLYFQNPKRKLKHKINQAFRRAQQLNATPKWITKDELEQIKQFYENCPAGYHVDHIIPLRGKNICGLHVLKNLQYLPALENIRKNNKAIL